MATAKIDTVDARTRLKPKSEPYWVKLSSGCTLGFRKLVGTSVGTWYVRHRDSDSGKRSKTSLGTFAELPPSQRYDAAKKAAEQRGAHLDRGGSVESIDVQKACENYVQHVRDKKGDKAADELKARMGRRVDGEAIAKVLLPKLTRRQVESWKSKLAKTLVVANPHAEKSMQRTRKRSPSSLNRDMTALRAALNYAHDLGDVTDDMAWRVALRPIENADRRRDLYLDREQRQKLMDSAEPAMRLFIRAMTLLPLRTGALAALTVADLDQKNGVLRVGKDKAGADRRIAMPAATLALLSAQAKDKLPAARLFLRPDGLPWSKDAWKVPMHEAATAAGLPAGTVAYTLRHSVITDLVVGGLDLLTVAQVSGTSVAMIEKHYGHLRQDHAKKALAALAM